MQEPPQEILDPNAAFLSGDSWMYPYHPLPTYPYGKALYKPYVVAI